MSDQVNLIVDPDKCIGYAECVSEDPDAIELGEDGVAAVLVAPMDRARAERLCEVCPVSALTWEPAG